MHEMGEKTTLIMVNISSFARRLVVMRRKRLGRTGLQVSVVGFGGYTYHSALQG